MKKIAGTLLIAAGIGLAALADDDATTTTAATPARFDFQLPDSIEMPGGEIYYHPKVVEVRPDGISIMHDSGVAFWPYNQLPEAVRNKFHYDPVAAQKYTDEMLLRRRQLDEMKIKKQLFDADEQVYLDLVTTRYQCTELRMKIDTVKRQIQWDKEKNQRLDRDVQQDRQVIANEMKSDDNSPSHTITTMFGNWMSSSTDDNAARMHVVGDYEHDMKQGETDYDMWKFAEHGQEDNLEEYIQDYHEAQARVKALEQKWAEIQKRRQMDQGQLDRKIHQQVTHTMADSMKKLQELRQMRDNQLITQEEYINKKAEILNRF